MPRPLIFMFFDLFKRKQTTKPIQAMVSNNRIAPKAKTVYPDKQMTFNEWGPHIHSQLKSYQK